MKKRLAAAITTALVVGVASTTFAAANPFVDVPAKHWAYDAVTKLAQAGIVDGYGDGTFRGDKTITRYEMAQIVAKAMTKSDKADATQKAAIDKLAVEFSAELNNLGVRVAKLEASQSNIKITGDARLRYVQTDTNDATNVTLAERNDKDFTYRLILNLDAKINDNNSFSGKLMTNGHRALGDNDTNAPSAGQPTSDDSLRVAEMAFTSKNVLGTGSSITAGRFSQKIGTTGYFLATTGMTDGIKATFGNEVKVTAGYANFKNAINIANVVTSPYTIEDAAFVTADYSLSKATSINGSYIEEQKGSRSDYKVYSAGVTAKVVPNLVLTGEYLKNTTGIVAGRTVLVDDPTGYVVKLGYKGANFAKKDTWGATVEYFKFEDGVLTAGGDYATSQMQNQGNNRKGFALTTNYTLSKNMVLTAIQTFNSKLVDAVAAAPNETDRPEYTRVQLDVKF